jgi:ubiquinone/menaquinone biosynthesis C-methylase UbiE
LKNITRATYDKIAPAFARVNAEMSENILQAAREFVKIVPKNGWCLDLGCGTGRDLAWFEQAGLNILGADLSTGMLTEARKITAHPLAQMDMLHLGLADRSFSGVWCNAALLHLPKTQASLALKEMYRILCSRGILDIAVQAGEGEQFEINPYEASLGKRFFARYQQDEMNKMLVENGFAILKTEKVFSKRTWLRFVAQRAN